MKKYLLFLLSFCYLLSQPLFAAKNEKIGVKRLKLLLACYFDENDDTCPPTTLRTESEKKILKQLDKVIMMKVEPTAECVESGYSFCDWGYNFEGIAKELEDDFAKGAAATTLMQDGTSLLEYFTYYFSDSTLPVVKTIASQKGIDVTKSSDGDGFTGCNALAMALLRGKTNTFDYLNSHATFDINTACSATDPVLLQLVGSVYGMLTDATYDDYFDLFKKVISWSSTNVNITSSISNSGVLHKIASNGLDGFLKELINTRKKDLNFDIQDADGNTAIHEFLFSLAVSARTHFAENSEESEARFLKMDKMADSQFISILVDEAKKNNILINPNKINKYGEAPIHVIGRSPVTEQSMAFLDFPDLDINAVNYEKETVIHILATNYNVPSKFFRNLNSIDMLNKIYEKWDDKVNIEAQDFEGNTPLHLAAQECRIDEINFLLDKFKASKMAKNTAGFLPYQLAEQSIKRGKASVQIGRIESENANGSTSGPLFVEKNYAQECKAAVKLLKPVIKITIKRAD